MFLKIGQMRAIIGMDKAQQFSMILRLVGAACRAWATFNPEQVEQIALQNQKIRNMTCMVQLQQIHTSYIELSLFEVLYIGIQDSPDLLRYAGDLASLLLVNHLKCIFGTGLSSEMKFLRFLCEKCQKYQGQELTEVSKSVTYQTMLS